MARKRKLSQSSNDDDDDDDGDFKVSDTSDLEDTYFPPNSTPRKKPRSTTATGHKQKNSNKKNTRQPLKKHRKAHLDASGDEFQASSNSGDDCASHPSLSLPHPTATHTVRNVRDARKALLAWYDTVHEVRGMPWRKPFVPNWSKEEKAQRAYEVWISEIMLQQTQVVTVIPYYNKWMAKFPTIKHLAESDIDTVNALWKGLGYYSRAARLLQGAQKAIKDLGGRLPDNAKDMQFQIPGIGRYSAGAICSIAYNQCVPVLDGNVHRLLSRFLALHAPPKSKQALDILWAGAEAIVQNSDRPGDVNQAMIELGSTVCKVHEPMCKSCPVQPWCEAYARREGKIRGGEISDEKIKSDLPDIEDLCTLCLPVPSVPTPVTAYPMKAEKKKAREELDVVSVVEWRPRLDIEGDRDRWFLLVRRPEGGLLAGLHEFPTASNVPTSSSAPNPQTMATYAHTSLQELLVHPPPPYMHPPAAPSIAAMLMNGVNKNKSKSKVQTKEQGELNNNLPPLVVIDSNPELHRQEEDRVATPSGVQIVKMKPAGDVLHIFSHIRKTYRTQWVLLVGGGQEDGNGGDENEEPPTLKVVGPSSKGGSSGSGPSGSGPKKNKGKSKAGESTSKGTKTKQERTMSKTKVIDLTAADSEAEQEAEQAKDPSPNTTSPSSNRILEAMWVRMDEVSDANIGTGVVKVWKQVQSVMPNSNPNPSSNSRSRFSASAGKQGSVPTSTRGAGGSGSNTKGRGRGK